MTKLPVLSGAKLCRVPEKAGYIIDHQTGSHIILRHEAPPHRRLTVPNHKEIARALSRPCGVKPACQLMSS